MIEKKGKKLNLKNIPVSVEDTNPQSTYFVITEFSDILTSGKNAIALNGSNLLKANSSIQVEVLDVKGDPLYTEIARTSDTIRYRDGVSLIVAIYVYGSTPLGTGEIIILGELKSGGTVRWKRNVNINSKKQILQKSDFTKLQNFTRNQFFRIFLVAHRISPHLQLDRCIL
jgi:hypothetical protein